MSRCQVALAELAPAISFRVGCHRASWKRTIPIYLPVPPVASADTVPVVIKMHLLNSMPIVALPTGLSNTNTGNLVADWLPLVTMLPCVPTLHLYYKTQRWPDLVRSCSSSTACSTCINSAAACTAFHSCAVRCCFTCAGSLYFGLCVGFSVPYMPHA